MDEWQQLNAYVDGELDLHDSAQLAQKIADNPELARQAAILSRARASLSDSVPVFDMPLRAHAQRPRRWVSYSLAASLLFVCVTLSLVWQRPADEVSSFVLGTHERWHASLASGVPPVIQTGWQMAGLPFVPDLSGVGLEVAFVERVAWKNRTGWHVGYLGSRGCRVSMLALDKGNERSEFALQVNATVPVHSWSMHGHDYFVVASRMPASRLQDVAMALFRATETALPPGAATLLALERSRVAAGPCLT